MILSRSSVAQSAVRRSGTGRLPSLVAVAVLLATLLAGAWPGAIAAQDAQRGLPGTATTPPAAPTGGVIVALKEGVDATALLRQLGVRPTYVYKRVFNGFAADLDANALSALRRNRSVELVSPDFQVFSMRQTIPTGVDRIDADRNPRADIDGDRSEVDVDIAILDSGISNHPDLNVVGGRSCIRGRDYRDRDGHGTHVAGTAAAKDNNIGVVGVAPGARLWAVRVLNDEGSGTFGSVTCGLEYVLENGEIEVVNMSLGARGDDGSCRSDNLHRAVCEVVEAGIPVVVSAGNEFGDTDDFVLGTWEQTIAVSSFNDYDGQPGGRAEPNPICVPAEVAPFYQDDTFTRFSNSGPDVDIAAPGVCILSTAPGDRYAYLSGTSMAAPHVTGAVALYLADRPNASVLDVRSWLRGTASVAQATRYGFEGDPDRFHEPVLYLGPGGGDTASPDDERNS